MGIARSNHRKGRCRAGGSAASASGRRVGGKPAAAKPLRFTIPSDFTAGRDVQNRILQDIEKLGFDCRCVFAVKLALEEAIINAIKHGNRLDPKKKVHIEARLTPAQIEIMVEDEGPGFDRDRVPDPLLDENIQKPCGRGLLLIEAYMSRVEYSRGGRRLRMIKKNEAQEEDPGRQKP